jgi:hypothetical protein
MKYDRASAISSIAKGAGDFVQEAICMSSLSAKRDEADARTNNFNERLLNDWLTTLR